MAPTSPHGAQLTTLRSWIWLCSPVMVSVLLASLSGYGYTWQWKLGHRDITVLGLPSPAPQQGPEWVLLNKPPREALTSSRSCGSSARSARPSRR